MEKESFMDDKIQYEEKCADYQSAINSIKSWEEKTLAEMPEAPAELACVKIKLADEMLDLMSHYLALNGLSQSLLKKKDEEMLNNGRKSLIKAVSYMEETVSPYLDVPYSDYQDKLELIEQVAMDKRYLLIRKMGLAGDLLKYAYGGNSARWRWSFVEIDGRVATIAKNFFDLKNALVNMDPRSPCYEASVYYLRLLKKMLPRSAASYREKYELAANVPTDFQKAIDFLNAMRYVHFILGEADDAEMFKKKADIWSAKLKADKETKKAIDDKTT
jgi:hypothetical protein